MDSTQTPLADIPKPSDWLSGTGLGGTAQLATLQTIPVQTCPCSQRDRQLLCKYLVLTPHALPPAAPARPPAHIEVPSWEPRWTWSLCNVLVILLCFFMPLTTLNFVKNHAGLAEGWEEEKCTPPRSREKIPAINKPVGQLLGGPAAPPGFCFLVRGPSCFSVVTWLVPSHLRCLCPFLPPLPACLPPHAPADSMIRDLASGFRLWDKSVNVGSSVKLGRLGCFCCVFPFSVRFLCPLPHPQVDHVAFSGTCPALRIFSSTL